MQKVTKNNRQPVINTHTPNTPAVTTKDNTTRTRDKGTTMASVSRTNIAQEDRSHPRTETSRTMLAKTKQSQFQCLYNGCTTNTALHQGRKTHTRPPNNAVPATPVKNTQQEIAVTQTPLLLMSTPYRNKLCCSKCNYTIHKAIGLKYH